MIAAFAQHSWFKFSAALPFILWAWLIVIRPLPANDEHHTQFEEVVQPLLVKYCLDCHSGPEPKARVDLAAIESPESIEAAFESLKVAVEAIESQAMPPTDQAQPTDPERQLIKTWFNDRYVHIAPRSAPLRPRRLSAHEYRQTLRSLIGFDLEVTVTEAEETVSEKSMAMKLLPTDPTGAAGNRLRRFPSFQRCLLLRPGSQAARRRPRFDRANTYHQDSPTRIGIRRKG